MSQSKETTKSVHVGAKGFGGIDANQLAGGVSSADICNFRLLSDGSLEKRWGFAPLLPLPEGALRTVWTGATSEGFACYVLCGADVYAVDLKTADLTYCGSVETQEGAADFFYYHDRLHLLDGEEIYEIREGIVRPLDPYVPLYGKNWKSGTVGEVNEPRSLLTRRIRIRYVMEEGCSMYLRTAFPVASLDGVYINGREKDPDDYEIDTLYTTVNVPGLAQGDTVELYLTLEEDVASSAALRKNTRGMVCGGVADSRVFFYGGEKKNVMFASRTVSNDSLTAARRVYEDCGALYVPYGCDFTVGDDRYAITALGRHYDRLLIFTENETYMASGDNWEREEYPIMRIHTAVGCAADRGAAMCGNDPVCIGQDAIYRFTSKTESLDAYHAYEISKPIRQRLSSAFFRNSILFANPFWRQLWFYQKDNAEGEVLTYSTEEGQWMRMDGIRAQCFFCGEDRPGFVRDGWIYLFDPQLAQDHDADGATQNIIASWSSNAMDFDMPHRAKRLGAISVMADFGNHGLGCHWQGDGAVSDTVRLWTEQTDAPAECRRRLSTGRFYRLRLCIRSDAPYRQRIYGFCLTARARKERKVI